MGAAEYDILQLPPPVEGLNRFEHEVALDGRAQCVDGLNAVELDGVTQRRPGYQTVYLPAGHDLPAGACTMFQYTSGGGLVHVPTRAGNVTAGAGDFILIGSETQFDSFFWRNVLSYLLVLTDAKLQLFYSVNGTFDADLTDTDTWTELPWFFDTTSRPISGNHIKPCIGNGRVGWHKSSFTGWTQMEVTESSGISRNVYAIAIHATSVDGEATANAINTTLEAKGVTVALHEPVNTVMSQWLRGGRVRVFGADRKKRRSIVEQGAMLSALIAGRTDARELGMAIDEFSGLYHTYAMPTFRSGAQNIGITGSTDTTTGGGNLGTADEVEKGSQWYLWRDDEHESGRERTDLGLDANSDDVNDVKINEANLPHEGMGTTAFEHMRLLGTGGFATQHEIYRSSAAGTPSDHFIYPDVAVRRVSTDTVNLDRPPRFLRIKGQEDRLLEILESDAHNLELVDRAFADVPSGGFTAYRGTQFHAEIVEMLRWKLKGRAQWSYAMDPSGRELLMTNGGPLLRYDGDRLREFIPDSTSALARRFANIVPSEDKHEILTSEATLYDKLPPLKYVAVYEGRIFGVPRQEPNAIIYSEGNGAFTVWHRLNYKLIIDDTMQPITGLTTWGSDLVIFTPSSIHLGRIVAFGDRTALITRPASKAFGWTTQKAVCKIDLLGFEALMGVSIDGITAFSGGEPRQVLDDWDRLLEGGVNKHRLHNACAAAWRSRRLAFFAVPSATSETNDRLLVYDYADRVWWAWTHPHGIASLTVERDIAGQERLLIGTVDGFVQALAHQDLDDGDTVTGSFTTAPSPIYEGREGTIHGAAISADVSGNQDLEVSLFLDRSKVATTTRTTPIYANPDDRDNQDAYFGTWVLDSAASDEPTATELGRRRFSTQRVRFDGGKSRGHLAQIKIGGSYQWKVRDIYLLARAGAVRGG